MARSSKGARNITVGDVHYRWRATGNDGWISVTVWPAEFPHPGIHGMLSYDETKTPSADGVVDPSAQLVVTNRIVRRIIEYAAAERGFDPAQKAKALDLGSLDGKVDLSDAERGS